MTDKPIPEWALAKAEQNVWSVWPDMEPRQRRAIRETPICQAIARAIAAERERVRWQPIATAPKDGRHILVCIDVSALEASRHWLQNKRIWIAHWADSNWRVDGVGCFPLVTQFMTHWMPCDLPPSPSNKGAE